MKNLLIGLSLMMCMSLSINAQNTLPDLNIEGIDGKKANIKELAAAKKLTIMSFWATWCKPCKQELNNIAEIYEEWQDNYDVQLIAISIDNARTAYKVKTYVDGQDWDYVVLLDKNQELKQSLNFQTVPYTLVINAEGEIVYRHQGYVEGDEYELEDKLKELTK
jgi:thiol-disulfide isomerase/thioredoxin